MVINCWHNIWKNEAIGAIGSNSISLFIFSAIGSKSISLFILSFVLVLYSLFVIDVYLLYSNFCYNRVP